MAQATTFPNQGKSSSKILFSCSLYPDTLALPAPPAKISDVLIKSWSASLDTWAEQEGGEITCKYLQELGRFLLCSDKRES